MNRAVIITLGLVTVFLIQRIGRIVAMMRILAIQNKVLQEQNEALLSYCPAPEQALSDSLDDDVRLRFAIKCGYMAALITHEAKEKPGKRDEALAAAFAYFERELPAIIADHNH